MSIISRNQNNMFLNNQKSQNDQRLHLKNASIFGQAHPQNLQQFDSVVPQQVAINKRTGSKNLSSRQNSQAVDKKQKKYQANEAQNFGYELGEEEPDNDFTDEDAPAPKYFKNHKNDKE